MILRNFLDFVLAFATFLAVLALGMRAWVEWLCTDISFEWQKDAFLVAAVVALTGVSRYLVLVISKERAER